MILWLALSITALIVAIALIQRQARVGTYRSLASRQPVIEMEHRPLGTEATDLDALAAANRRNAALDGLNAAPRVFGGAKSHFDATHIPAEADDADYARRYHLRWNPKDRKGTPRP